MHLSIKAIHIEEINDKCRMHQFGFVDEKYDIRLNPANNQQIFKQTFFSILLISFFLLISSFFDIIFLEPNALSDCPFNLFIFRKFNSSVSGRDNCKKIFNFRIVFPKQWHLRWNQFLLSIRCLAYSAIYIQLFFT